MPWSPWANRALPTRRPWGSYSPHWSISRKREATEPHNMLTLRVLEETRSETVDPGLGTGTLSSLPPVLSLPWKTCLRFLEKQELEEPGDAPEGSCPLEVTDSPLDTPLLPPSSCPLTRSQMRGEFKERGASCFPAPGSLWMLALCRRLNVGIYPAEQERDGRQGGEVGWKVVFDKLRS